MYSVNANVRKENILENPLFLKIVLDVKVAIVE